MIGKTTVHKLTLVLTLFLAAFLFTTMTGTASAANTGTITVVLATNPAGGTGFEFQASYGQWTLDDGQTHVRNDLFPGDQSIFQTVQVGYDIDIQCVGGTATPIGSNGVTVSLNAGDDVTCTFTNTNVGGSISIVNATTPAGQTGFTYQSSLGNFSLDDGQNQDYDPLNPGNYSFFQDIPAGFQLSIDCGTANITLEGSNGVTVHLGSGDNVVCTFNNTDVGGSITVINTTVPAGATGFTYFSDIGSFTLDDGQSYQVTAMLPGDYNVLQNIPAGYDLDITCTGGDSTPIPSNGVTVHLDAGEDVICTFTNTYVGGSLTVIAASNPAGGTGFEFASTVGSFTLDDGQGYQAGDLYPNDYDIFATVQPGHVLDITCTGADTTSIGANGIRVHLDANEDATCTFTQTDVAGSITIINTSNPAGGTGYEYNSSFGDFTLDDGQTQQYTELLPGTYAFFATIQSGDILDITCTGGDSSPLGSNGIDVHIDPNEDIVCTFTHSDVGGTITIAAQSIPAGLTGINFFGTLGAFTLDDGATHTYTDTLPGDYDMFQNIPAGYELTIDCVGGDSTSIPTNGVTIHMDANEDITCTFTNTDPTYVADLIVNGDFEQGQGIGWEEWSTNYFDLVVDENAYGGTVPPQSGTHLAWLGGANYEESFLWQEVTLPAGQNAVVDFSFWIESSDYCGYDWFIVYAFDGSYYYQLGYASLCARNNTNGWVAASVDVTAFAGQTIDILFYGYSDSVYPSSVFVDDVSLEPTAQGNAPESMGLLTGSMTALAGSDMAEIINTDRAELAIATEAEPRNNVSPADSNVMSDREAPTAVTVSETGIVSTTPSMLSVLVALFGLVTALFVQRKTTK